MKKILLIFPLLVLTFIYSEQVNAQDVDYARSAWYVSVAGSFDVHLFESTANDVSDGVVDLDNAWGIDIKVGKRIYTWLSLEVEYEYINGFDFSIFDVKVNSLQVNTLTGNVKFHYPIQRFIPYAVLGIGGAWYRVTDDTGLFDDFDSDTALAGRAGVGFDLFLNQNWAVNANYTVVLSTYDLTSPTELENVSDVHYGAFQVGIAYYF